MNITMHKDEFRIGKYRLLELLSEGRYTDIWLAEHIDIKKNVAIKILFPQEVRAGNARLLAKKLLFNEAQTLAQLTHPHIVQAFDYEEEEEHERPAGVVPQSEFAKQGDVLVASYPGALRYWQSDEDFWDPMFTSDGDDIGTVLNSRWQKFWGRVRSVWERIAEFLLES